MKDISKNKTDTTNIDIETNDEENSSLEVGVDQFKLNESYYSEIDLSSDSSDSEVNYEILNNDFIYSGSNIKVNDFALSFLVLCKRINITTAAKNILLDYIATLLPFSNKIPSSYKKLIKRFSFNSYEKKSLCNSCLMEKCACEIPSNHKVSIFEFNLANQISSIVRKNWQIICNYKGICLNYTFANK